MSATTRLRLARTIRRSDCDLAEAALLCCAEIEPEVDVDVELLRLDALADGLRTRGFQTAADPRTNAVALSRYLAETIGFRGDDETYEDPRNALLTRVLDSRRGLPITLSIVYIAIARRLRIPAFGIGLPGHFVTGIGEGQPPIVLDPFHGGRLLDEGEVARRVRDATSGRLEFRRAMLRPASPPMVIRRVLNNLTRDFAREGDARNALWTVELKLLLPNRLPDDHRVRGELLVQLGQYRQAAEAYEVYLEEAPGDTDDHDEVAALAVRARAKLN